MFTSRLNVFVRFVNRGYTHHSEDQNKMSIPKLYETVLENMGVFNVRFKGNPGRTGNYCLFVAKNGSNQKPLNQPNKRFLMVELSDAEFKDFAKSYIQTNDHPSDSTKESDDSAELEDPKWICEFFGEFVWRARVSKVMVNRVKALDRTNWLRDMMRKFTTNPEVCFPGFESKTNRERNMIRDRFQQFFRRFWTEVVEVD